ncbi:hypothetical protein EC396_16575 [Lutibacter sp. HS1-25]|uniref:BamA/TamA family outer membrane protein n=1 Tax=Lutibacter sp. HS1-25 TaxID=2485000 RepID=UPI00101262D2|nr:BamA/TamA family outer membrane protein [Lutibacter sp. HS1-25]RXP44776.1 hypothetical protein EC396_16575 [Lutibacter sp. HS1-25]
MKNQITFRQICCLLLLILCTHFNQIFAQKEEKKKISFKDSLDGAFDISEFLIEPQGFMPIPIIVTEPAVGYGGGLAALFITPQKKKYDVPVPPNISGVIGLGTSNKTWMAALFHFHVWGPDKIRYLGAVAKPSVNIKYYGNNSDFLSKNPIEFNLDAWLVMQRVNVRVAKSNLFVGGSYMFFQGKTKFEPYLDTPVLGPIFDKLLSKLNNTTTISMLTPMVNWDTRNNIFTPSKGVNTGFQFMYNATWLGGDQNYYQINPYFLGYQKISDNILSAFRFDSNFMIGGDSPFYAKPFIQLRGVPAMKYQSDNTMLVETEWKFKVYKRWSLDFFGGTGKAFKSFDEFGPATLVYNYGLGFRYKLARLFDVDAGVDFAWSNNKDFAFSIVFGSAWSK